MISQHITWHTARFPPAVGVGVPDDPFLRPPPDPRCRAGCGRRGPPAMGGPPARVPPLTPSCASLAMGRSARCGARPGAPPLDPARFFVKKRGKKLLNASLHLTQPLALGASDPIRPRSGHLSGRVAPPTRVGEAGGPRNLTGAPPPQKRFSLGLHPVSLGKTKEMGWNRQHKVKPTSSKPASSSHPKNPGGPGTPPLQVCRTLPRKRTAHRGAGRSICAQGLFVVV